MIRLSKSTDYALMALADLALLPGGQTLSARRMAEHHRLPPELAAKVLQSLKRSGIVKTRRGIHGGYRLARPAGEITVTEIIESVEGPLAFVECVLDDPGCSLVSSCSVRTPLQQIHARLLALLSDLTLAEVVADAGGPTELPAQPQLPVLQ